MGLKINPGYVAYTLKNQLKLENVSNESIAECLSSFFLDSDLGTSVEILNLTLHKVLKNYQGDKPWTAKEEQTFREFKDTIDESEPEGFASDIIEF